MNIDIYKESDYLSQPWFLEASDHVLAYVNDLLETKLMSNLTF